jgi:hypothetical protein
MGAEFSPETFGLEFEDQDERGAQSYRRPEKVDLKRYLVNEHISPGSDDMAAGVCGHLLEAIVDLRSALRESLDHDEQVAIRKAIMMIRYLLEQASA